MQQATAGKSALLNDYFYVLDSAVDWTTNVAVKIVDFCTQGQGYIDFSAQISIKTTSTEPTWFFLSNGETMLAVTKSASDSTDREESLSIYYKARITNQSF